MLAIESARTFNPECPIFLLGTNNDKQLKRFHVDFIALDDLETSDHRLFLDHYHHLSVNPFDFEIFCFSRWFYIDACMKKYDLRKAIHLDSDCLLFDSFENISDRLSEHRFALSHGGGPHCTWIQENLDPLLNLILESYTSKEKLQSEIEHYQKNQQAHRCDMFSWNQLQNSGIAKNYSEMSLNGIFEHNIGMDERFEKGRKRKRIIWKLEEGLLIPYLKKDGQLVRAFNLHYKGGAKRWMRRFNPWKSKKNAFLRALRYNLAERIFN